ncbi:hypothetical protein DOTSEDRAFT_60639 [Dothistroma septosporum NZE10]|uniref:Cytochrome P450 n=1 Tax=Dothistroma septosporum (strain NZE10 / CBS 128990) TaxID=675120 RepID=N1PR23_DOTSN|nr:hypothetical protein DOTSEDRAFT_60639 [Dothistroma septosporum NZE10]
MELVLIIYKVLTRTTALLCAIVALVYFFFLRPPREPKNTPAVPFCVTLIPLFRDTDQKVLYNKHIREPLLKYGAIKIFFGSQWNLLVERPSYVAQIFKHEDEYQKSGNQKKIPGSVLASFLGDNIISSHGDVWRLYQEIMKPGIQGGRSIDAVRNNAKLLLSQLSDAMESSKGGPLPVGEFIQRYTIANLVQTLLGVDINMDQRTNLQADLMNFPYLDTLGLASREKARRDAGQFTDRARGMDLERQDPEDAALPENQYKLVGRRLTEAWQEGRITEQQLRDNITIVFVAGQENPQLALLSTLHLLAKHPEWQNSLHAEATTLETDSPTADQLNDLLHLTTCVNESLRLMPLIGQLINRLATSSLVLGDDHHHVPEGTYVGYNSYATNCDPEVWGKDADEFVPGRWGNTIEEVRKQYRRRKARAEFITFHGGRRACLGESFAVLELKVTIFVLTRYLRWRVDPEWPEKMTPAGPLAPRGLRLVFEKRS